MKSLTKIRRIFSFRTDAPTEACCAKAGSWRGRVGKCGLLRSENKGHAGGCKRCGTGWCCPHRSGGDQSACVLVAVVRNSADDGTVAPEYVILNHLPPVATCCHCHVIECGNPLVRHIFPKMPPLFHSLCFRSVHLQGGIIHSSTPDRNVL